MFHFWYASWWYATGASMRSYIYWSFQVMRSGCWSVIHRMYDHRLVTWFPYLTCLFQRSLFLFHRMSMYITCIIVSNNTHAHQIAKTQYSISNHKKRKMNRREIEGFRSAVYLADHDFFGGKMLSTAWSTVETKLSIRHTTVSTSDTISERCSLAFTGIALSICLRAFSTASSIPSSICATSFSKFFFGSSFFHHMTNHLRK